MASRFPDPRQKVQPRKRFVTAKPLTEGGASGTYEPIIIPGTVNQYWGGDKNWHTLDKFDVRTAGEALGGQRAIRVGSDGLAYLANPDSTALLTIGITTGAVILGATATIQIDGELTEPSWAWTSTGPVYLAASGILTQSVPTSGAIFQIGIPMGPITLRIAPQMIAFV